MLLVVEYNFASCWLSYIIRGEIYKYYSMNIPQWWMLALLFLLFCAALQFSDWLVRISFEGYKVDEISL